MDTREKRLRYAKGNVIELALAAALFFLGVLLPQKSETAMLAGLFTPLEVTVSIWSIVYALLLVFCIYTVLPSVRNNPERGIFIERVSFLFMLACILNISWIGTSYYGYVTASAVISVLLLAVLAIIYLRLKIGIARAPRAETYLVQVPFRVYLGWVVMVTIANTSNALAELGWDGFGLGPQLWSLLGIFLSVAVAVVMLVKRGDVWFSLVIAAALLGLFLDRLLGAGASEQTLITVAGMGAVMVAGGILYLTASGYKRDTRPFKA